MQIVRVRSAAGGAALLALAGVLATGRDAGAAAGLAPSTGWEGERGGVVLVWPGAAPRSLIIELYDHLPTTIEPPACVAYDVPREDLRFECITPLRRCRRSIAVRGARSRCNFSARAGATRSGITRA